MAAEQYTNLAATTLNGAIDDNDLSLVVTSATNFPGAGDFKIIIDSEIIKVTAVSGTTFTIVRAQEGTSAAAHSSLAPLTHVVTAASLVRIINQNVCGQDVIGSRPAAGDAGRLFIPTSGLTLQRDTGTVWTPYGPLHKFKQGFALADYTGVNTTGGSTAVIADQGGIIHVHKPPQAGINVSYWVKTAPSPPYTIVAAFQGLWSRSTAVPCFGLCFANSGATPHGIGPQHTNTTHIQVTAYTSNTAQGFRVNPQECIAQPIWWLRISDDGTTNKRYWISIDGVNWFLFYSEARTTTYTPNQVGFFVDHQSGAASQLDMHVNMLSWEETTDSV